MKSSTETLIKALQILAQEIESPDGVANQAIAEAAERLQGLSNDPLDEQVVELSNERDALAAQVERLRAEFNQAFAWEDVRDAFKMAPAQCLAEHDAKVVEDAAATLFSGDARGATTIRMILCEHANQLRQQAKGKS